METAMEYTFSWPARSSLGRCLLCLCLCIAALQGAQCQLLGPDTELLSAAQPPKQANSSTRPIGTNPPSWKPPSPTTKIGIPPPTVATIPPRPSVTVTAKPPKPPATVTTKTPKPPATVTTKSHKPPATVTTKQPKPPATVTTKPPKPPATVTTKPPKPPATVTTKPPKPPATVTTKSHKPPATVTTKPPKPAATVTTKPPSSASSPPSPKLLGPGRPPKPVSPPPLVSPPRPPRPVSSPKPSHPLPPKPAASASPSKLAVLASAPQSLTGPPSPTATHPLPPKPVLSPNASQPIPPDRQPPKLAPPPKSVVSPAPKPILKSPPVRKPPSPPKPSSVRKPPSPPRSVASPKPLSSPKPLPSPKPLKRSPPPKSVPTRRPLLPSLEGSLPSWPVHLASPPWPPAPPRQSTGSDAINITYNGYGGCEPNVCNSQQCGFPSRTELLVQDESGGQEIWAPLCAVKASADVLDAVAKLICNQYYDWPMPSKNAAAGGRQLAAEIGAGGNSLHSVMGVAYEPFKIPDPPTAGTLDQKDPGGASAVESPWDPSTVSRWATVTSWGNITSATSLQDLQLQVSLQPCESGHIFAVYCMLLVK